MIWNTCQKARKMFHTNYRNTHVYADIILSANASAVFAEIVQVQLLISASF